MVNFAGILFNGIFDKYPKVALRLHGSRRRLVRQLCGTFRTLLEQPRAVRSARSRFLKLRDKESITDYIKRHVDEGRIFIGVEGDELTLPFAVSIVGNKPFIFSSDFPHEVNNDTCKGGTSKS